MTKRNVIIFPPCGENVALATKRGANKVLSILPLLPRLTAVLPPQGREITTRGFTLIELLVVVLIIGILAAVAVPQYQKAVEKSKVTKELTLFNAVVQAIKLFHLETGTWPTSFSQLSIDIPFTGNAKSFTSAVDWKSNDEWTLDMQNDSFGKGIILTRRTGPYAGTRFIYQFYRAHSEFPTNQLLCLETLKGTYCEKIFKAIYHSKWDYYYYIMPNP